MCHEMTKVTFTHKFVLSNLCMDIEEEDEKILARKIKFYWSRWCLFIEEFYKILHYVCCLQVHILQNEDQRKEVATVVKDFYFRDKAVSKNTILSYID